jgi:2-oxo-4-hydroxy-4-carboxy-5-ureidoimidazoline decarboxylase
MLTASALSGMSCEAFVGALAGIWENSPWVSERAWQARPFADMAALHAAMVRVVDAASDDEKLALIRAHPELAGRAAIVGDVTAESREEQGRAGLNRCSEIELARLTDLNRRYSEKFGFPFVLAVSGHSRASIIENFERRLTRPPAEERAECLRQIARIAWLRLEARF